MSKFKFGTIGTNFISHTFAEATELSGVAEISAVYSRKAETGTAFGEKYGVPRERIFTSLDALAASGIDGVYIASPNLFHAEQALFFLERGIPVLVEKPAAPSARDFERMLAASRESGAVVMEAMRQGHDPLWQTVREALPKVGRVRHAAFEFCQYSSRYDRHKAGEYTNTFDPALCNSSLRDIGIYPLYCLVMLFGEPEAVYTNSIHLKNGFEGCGELTLSYGDFTASALYSKIYDSARPSAIFGEEGCILIDKLSVPAAVTLVRKGEEPILLGSARVGNNNMIWEIRHFVTLARGGNVDHPCNDVTAATLRIIDRVQDLL